MEISCDCCYAPNEPHISRDCSVYICSRNPIAVWAIEHFLNSSNWRFHTCFPNQLLVVPQGLHIVLIDICSILEWPETVRRWTDAGHRTVLLVTEGWDSSGAELRALHLGVRGIVYISADFVQHLAEAVNIVAQGHLFAGADTLSDFYGGSRRLRSPAAASHLSFREEQVIDLLVQGFSNRRIGTVLGISERTAKFHVCNILRKMQVKTRRELLDRHGNALEQRQIKIVS